MSKWRPNKNPGCLFVIPDVHGCFEELCLILDRILPLRNNVSGKDYVVFLGDYIDRGSKSYEVIETLIHLKKKYKDQVICLRGNHEQLLLNSLGLGPKGSSFTLNSISDYGMWINNGGCETISNYFLKQGVEIKNPKELSMARCLSAIDKNHIEFIKNETQLMYEHGDFVFAHAAIDPNLPLDKQDEEVLLWDRSLFNAVKSLIAQDKELPWDKIFVTGHNYSGPFISDKFMMLDASSKGILLCVELYSMEAYGASHGNNRLVKYKLEETKVKKASFRRANS